MRPFLRKTGQKSYFLAFLDRFLKLFSEKMTFFCAASEGKNNLRRK